MERSGAVFLVSIKKGDKTDNALSSVNSALEDGWKIESITPIGTLGEELKCIVYLVKE